MKKILLGLLFLGASVCLPAKTIARNPMLGEQVTKIPVVAKGLIDTTVLLETTLFIPPGSGPFPIVVMNHGKASGNNVFQARSRPLHIVLEFLRRGYVVVVPNRRGFSESEGSQPTGMGCGLQYESGLDNADDVIGVLDWVVKQSWADKNSILVMGQSHGGLTTLALGARGYPGVKGLVNFAGVLRGSNCNWEPGMISAMSRYGRTSNPPSLWFYGANDSYTGPELAQRFMDAYTKAGGRARLVAFGVFGQDAHGMSGSAEGVKIWLPDVEAFLRQIGLPAKIVNPIPDSVIRHGINIPPPSGFARLEDSAAVPYLEEVGRKGYAAFLKRVSPRAFSISSSGGWGWASGTNAASRSIDFCLKKSNGAPCQLYAVDDEVVWSAGRDGGASR
ncbi:dienelactone hydrolase family protein [Formivibrio citricus]|nr:CocE/NonD family hydrolase [Formivibrio citricus]